MTSRTLAAAGTGATDAAHYYAALTRSIDSIFDLEVGLTRSLMSLLEQRVATFQREVLQTLAWAALGLLVVSVIGFFIMRDITVTLGRVVDRQPRSRSAT